MRRVFWIIAILAATAPSLADVVYMNDGTSYEGKAKREGKKVRIERPDGTLEFDASDVLYIDTSNATSQPAATARPIEASALAGRFSIGQASQPEPAVFTLMRNLSLAQAGDVSYYTRQELGNWKAMAHERKRRITGAWIDPHGFTRHRQTFLVYREEARKLYRQARQTGRDRNRDPKEKAKRSRLLAQAASKDLQAAKSWADPLLKRFLMGIAYYNKRDYRAAEQFFRRCTKQAPRVAAFWQGYGMALGRLNRHLKAVEAFSAVLRLRPESSEALRSLREAMRNTPGNLIKQKEYLQAAELASEYPEAQSRSRRGVTWLMPGEDWSVREEGLPMPTYDRLVFKQAVAVPVGEQTLLMDESIVEDAAELFVRIDNETTLPISTRRGSRSAGSDVPMATVKVEAARFTPINADEDAAFDSSESVTVHAINIFEEMGTTIREIPLSVEAARQGGGAAVASGLAPGEGTAPLITADGRLLGFLAGRTDATLNGGGEKQFIPLKDFAKLIRRTSKRSGRSNLSRRSTGRGKRRVTPKDVQGAYFLVSATYTEQLKP